MGKQVLLLLLLLVITTGCNRCSDIDCIGNSPFLFQLTNEQGDNLLDTKAISADQIRIYSVSNQNDPLEVAVFQQDNQSWMKAYLKETAEAYTLEIRGVNTYQLTFDIEANKTECCGTIYSIREAYVDGQALADTYEGWKNIIIR